MLPISLVPGCQKYHHRLSRQPLKLHLADLLARPGLALGNAYLLVIL